MSFHEVYYWTPRNPMFQLKTTACKRDFQWPQLQYLIQSFGKQGSSNEMGILISFH